MEDLFPGRVCTGLGLVGVAWLPRINYSNFLRTYNLQFETVIEEINVLVKYLYGTVISKDHN